MARKLLPPTTFNAAAVREEARAAWLAKRKKNVTTMERIGRSRPFWLVFIFAAVVSLSAAHTTAAFQQVIGVTIHLPFGITIPLGIAGVIAIEFGLLWASFGRFHGKQTGERVELIIYVMEVLFFIAAVLINATGSLNVLYDQHYIGGQDDAKIFGGLVMVAIFAIVIPICLVIVGTGLARLVYDSKHEPDRFADDWLRDGPDILHLAFHDELLRLGESPSRANALAAQLVKATFKTAPAKPTPATEKRKAPEKPESNGTEQEENNRPKLPTNDVIKRLHLTYPGFSELPLKEQADQVMRASGRGQSSTYAALEKYRAWVVNEKAASSNGNGGPNHA